MTAVKWCEEDSEGPEALERSALSLSWLLRHSLVSPYALRPFQRPETAQQSQLQIVLYQLVPYAARFEALPSARGLHTPTIPCLSSQPGTRALEDPSPLFPFPVLHYALEHQTQSSHRRRDAARAGEPGKVSAALSSGT